MPRERVARALLVAYMAWIFYAALGAPPPAPEIPYIDKLMHALAWGGMALLCLFSWPRRLAPALLLPAAHGAITELLQGYVVVGRRGEWLDFLADLLGAATIIAVVAYARRRRAASA